MKRHHQNIRTFVIAACLIAMTAASSLFPGVPGATSGAGLADTLASVWGIEVASLRMSAGGRMVDFRYKVLDPDKAAVLSEHEAKAYLVDQASGRKLLVPKSPKIGPLRQTAQKPEPGKVYFALFSNTSQSVKPGSKVTVVMGDFRAENLTVE